MDLLKAKIYLDKINREFGRMSQDPENILRIDIDIMQTYVRQLYDACLSGDFPVPQPPVVVSTLSPARKPAPPAPASEPQAPPAPAEPSIPAVLYTPPPQPVIPPQPVMPPPPVVVPPAPAVESNPNPAPPAAPEQMFTPAPPPPPAHKPHQPSGVEVLFEQKEARELVEKLSEQPIQDLRRAIALNDRLLYTRELFANDNQLFENTITFLNHCTHIEEAKAYLIEHCVHQLGWTDKKKVETAKGFIKLARRLFK